MSMRKDIHDEVLPRIVAEFGFKEKGPWLQMGKCPACNQREFFTRKDNPWVLKCGRANKCGVEYSVKELYPDIFDTWSNRIKPTPQNPNASAEAYLESARGLKLLGLRGHFDQEVYKCPDRGITSATVRFTLPNGAKWERLIDQPSRFDRKANFKGGYGGYCWMAPDQGYEVLARADRIWITEGIFDTLSWRQVGEYSAAAMASGNYPEHFLAELKKEVAAQNLRGPEIIWAFDAGKAGTEYTLKFVARAREDGWRTTAAQPVAEGQKQEHDWNDLLMRNRLRPEDIDTYLWNGRILLAESASEKAVLLWERHRRASFSFVHDSRTWWASFDQKKITEVIAKEEVSELFAARACAEVSLICNCAFRILYAQAEPAGDKHFYLEIDVYGSDRREKARFSSGALTAGSEFKKALMGASGALWEGSGRQLDKLVAEQTFGMKTVTALNFTGFSRDKDHRAWVLGDICVARGKVYKINAEDYFDLGKSQLKLAARDPRLDIEYDADTFDVSWATVIWRAFGPNGLVVTIFWLMSFFAEQIRERHKSLPFLEMSGIPGTGKSTLIEFLWKLCGRDNYEGFDPSKATAAALARNLAKVSNLPVVFMEGDRNDNAPHSRKFDWNETKPFYNGRIVRSRGKATGGNETDESPFRGALVIDQNNQVSADPAVMERIVQMTFTKDGWSPDTKAAATELEHWPIDRISGTIVHLAKREDDILKRFVDVKDRYERAFLSNDRKVRNGRLRHNFAQIHSGLDAFAPLLKLTPDIVKATHAHIDALALLRDKSLESDHPVVATFWETFDWLENSQKPLTPDGEKAALNHSKSSEKIAINLLQFEAACKRAGLTATPTEDLKKFLKSSKSRPFIEITTVNSAVTGRTTYCWVFQTEAAAQSKKGS